MIIIAAYLPIVSLAGIEGKMFRPMAFTVILALSGALILSWTLVPALCAIFLRESRLPATNTESRVHEEHREENPLIRFLQRLYRPLLSFTVKHRRLTALVAVLFLAGCAALFPFLGAEFLPKLDEGAIAINVNRVPSVSLPEAVKMTTALERLV